MTLDHWGDFYLGVLGAAAALTGLVIVAISVNVERILKFPQLPLRAAATIGALVSLVVVSTAALAPQPLVALGIETGAVGLSSTWLQLRPLSTKPVNPSRRREFAKYALIGPTQSLPFVVGGLLWVLELPAGSYLVLAGVLAVFVLSMFNAWVLLVEVLR